MRSLVPKLLVASVVLLALVWVPAASAAPTYGGSFKVSATEASNLKITSGPDGNVWMTLAGSAEDVAKITPSGAVTEYELPGIANPRGIATGPEGNLWVTFEGGVAKFSPLSPKTTAVEFAIPKVKQGSSIVAGPEGRMWVATEGALISFLPAEVVTSEGEVPIAGLSPHDIDVAGSSLVVADAGNGRIVTVHPTPLPTVGEVKFVRNPTGTAQGVAGNPTGQIAFTESDGLEGLALATPPAPAMSIAHIGDPFGVTLGPDGAYYFAMSAEDDLERLTPTGELSAVTGFPPKFFPRQITAGPGFTLWVAMEIPGENIVEVARITGVEPPKPVTTSNPPPPINPIVVTTKPVPDTSFGKGPKPVVKVVKGKATVKFSFSSTVAGSTFQCRLFKVPTGKGKSKKPRGAFTSCRSPKVLHVAPGKYRFGVRAVAAGVTDGSAAERAFTVVRIRPHR